VSARTGETSLLSSFLVLAVVLPVLLALPFHKPDLTTPIATDDHRRSNDHRVKNVGGCPNRLNAATTLQLESEMIYCVEYYPKLFGAKLFIRYYSETNRYFADNFR